MEFRVLCNCKASATYVKSVFLSCKTVGQNKTEKHNFGALWKLFKHQMYSRLLKSDLWWTKTIEYSDDKNHYCVCYIILLITHGTPEIYKVCLNQR